MSFSADTLLLQAGSDTTIQILQPTTLSVVVEQPYSGLAMALIAGVIASFVAAFLFLVIKLTIRPRIAISPVIVDRVRLIGGNRQELYQLKFVNKGYFPIEDINISVYVVTRYGAGSGNNQLFNELKLKDSHIDRVVGKLKNNSDVNDRCVLVEIIDNVTNEWNSQDKQLHIQISSRHPITGFRRVVTKRLLDCRSCITKGYFKSGPDFAIMTGDG